MALKLLQFGDMHLDGAFERLSPEKAAWQRKASRALLLDIVLLAKEKKADLILCTGDLFDGPAPYYDTIEAAAQAFAQAKIPVFIAPGNHDWFDDTSPYAAVKWSENVHIFQSLTPKSIVLPEISCRVTGVGYPSRRPSGSNGGPGSPNDGLGGFSAPADGLIHIFVAHGDYGNAGEYLVFPEEAVKRANLSYLALGHAHSFSVSKAGDALVVQNGSVEGHGFDEPGEKGVVWAEIDGQGAKATLCPLPGSRCVPVTLDITPFCESADGECSAGSVRPAGPEQAIASAASALAAQKAPPERTFLRLLLTGTGEPSLAKIAEFLEGFLALRLKSTARPKTEPFAKAGDDSLTGLFVRLLQEKYDAANEQGKDKILLALSFGLAALENREEPAALFRAEGQKEVAL